ncbi:MATE family efflux transporter [Marinomonas sp. 2405UD68-3]|uniref:MATE family efflux transporter n=1 Tax=Marinomonas sp. 2405UD68-3 TaxID=3391835 RepID=UPI0039C8EC14
MTFITLPHFKTLYQQTMPMLIGLFSIMGGQLIDSAFIGQLGEEPLAIVGVSIPIFQLIIGIQVGIGIAATSCISTAIGEQKLTFAKNLSAIILVLGSLLVALLCTVLWLFKGAILYAIFEEASLLDLLRSYWFPWLLSCWMGAVLYFGYSICRSFGQTLIAGKVMIITSVINIALDPIFIFTLKLGLAGAAWATCIAYIIGLLIIFKYIQEKNYVAFPNSLSIVKKGTHLISRFTTPALLSQFLPPISAILVTSIVVSYGNAAIGAWGLANRIEYILIILILAITMALPPMIGKLKGSNNYIEIEQITKTAIIFIIMVQSVLAVITIIASPSFTSLLTTEAQIKNILIQYLFLIPISYGALGICMISVSACNAIGEPTSALAISILRLLACYLPLVWIGSEIYGLEGIFIGASIGNFISGIVGWKLFIRKFNQLRYNSNSEKQYSY